jgi:hypothetical protein
MNDEEILAEFAKKAPNSALQPFVLKIDGQTFILGEVTHKGYSFNLKLAKAYPLSGGPPIIILQTEEQITAQVREFVNEHQPA